jgi:hypothetical protein
MNKKVNVCNTRVFQWKHNTFVSQKGQLYVNFVAFRSGSVPNKKYSGSKQKGTYVTGSGFAALLVISTKYGTGTGSLYLSLRDWVVGWYFLHFSHQAGVICSGHRLQHSTSPKVVTYCKSICSFLCYTIPYSSSGPDPLQVLTFFWVRSHGLNRIYK